MFSKEESKRLRQEFWTSFGKSFPRKWVLYNTKVKDLALKFTFEKKFARVSMDIEHSDPEKRAQYFSKLESLKDLLITALPNVVFEPKFILENYKEISSIYVQLDGVSIHNKQTWQQTMLFLKGHMDVLESFWLEYEDYIKS